MRISRLSASSYKCEDQCPFKFFLNYHLRIKGGQTFAAEYGTVIHEILERYAQAKNHGTDQRWQDHNKTGDDGWTPEQIEQEYVNLILANGWRSDVMADLWPDHRHVKECPKTCDECEFYKDDGICGIVNSPVEDMVGYDPEDKEKVEDPEFGCPLAEFREGVRQVEDVIFDDKPYAPFAEGHEIVATEQYFKLEVQDGDRVFLATGLIDLVTKTGEDTIEIFDYKTGRYKMSFPESLKDIQLLMYYYAAKKLYPEYKNHMVTIYYLCGGKKQITPPFGPRDEVECIQMLKRKFREIKSNDLPQRRCDTPDGRVEFDHKCKYLCDMDLCKTVHPQFLQFVSNGGNIDDLRSLEDLETFVLKLNVADGDEDQEEE